MPGLLFGACLAGLVFFLNPQIPFAAVVIVRAVLSYGSLLGIFSSLVHLILLGRRSDRFLRLLPWTVACVFAYAAWLMGAHASHFAYYLPPGINDRLVKAALWLGLAALIFFYTALLHTLHRRPYGRRSRLGLTGVALLSLAVLGERRVSFRERPVPVPRRVTVEASRRPHLLVVALDGATLDAILPLVGSGRLPFFSELVRDGTYARLATIQPTRRDALWTTLATGKFPFQHGVTGWRGFPAPYLCRSCSLNLLPQGIRFSDWGLFGEVSRLEPDDSRRALALWEILSRWDIRCGVVGWPRAGAVGGSVRVSVPERVFAQALAGSRLEPGREALFVDSLRGAAGNLSSPLLASFAAGPLSMSRPALVGDRWRLTVAERLVGEFGPVDAEFVFLPGLREVSRRTFGGFSGVQFDGSKRREARSASDELSAYYGFLDSELARLWASSEGPRALAVVSAYGTRTAQGFERILGEVSTARWTEGRFQGAPDGVLLLYGSDFRNGELLTGARVVDVVPTLLYALGMPLARDLDGRVLTGAFSGSFLARNPVSFLPSFEGIVTRSASPAQAR